MRLKAFAGSVSRNTLLAGTVVGLLIVHTILWMISNSLPGHDQVSYLFEARRLLAGAALYGPFVSETNPPLIIWFSAIPVFLSRLAHGSEGSMFYMVLSALGCGSVLWCVRLMRVRGLRPFALSMLVAALILVECPELISLFGQRENLMLICILPYIIAVAFNSMPSLSIYERGALGMAAGLAVCFKPQQTLILIGTELAIALMTRSLRHLMSCELVAAITTCIVYVACIGGFAPLYFKQTLPLLVDCYWAFGSFSASALVLRQAPELAFLLVAIMAALFLSKENEAKRPVILLAAAALASSLAFAIQHTGWGYQQYPALAFTALALFAGIILTAGPLIERLDGRATPFVQALAVLVLCALLAGEWKRWRAQDMPNDAGIFGGLSKGDPVYIVSTDVSFFAIADSKHLDWGSRFVHLWMLPSILENEHRDRLPGAPFKGLAPARVAELASIQRTQLAEDLNHWKPKIVAVEDCPCPFINQNIDLLKWFSVEPAFKAAWLPYVPGKNVPGFRVYRRSEQ